MVASTSQRTDFCVVCAEVWGRTLALFAASCIEERAQAQTSSSNTGLMTPVSQVLLLTLEQMTGFAFLFSPSCWSLWVVQWEASFFVLYRGKIHDNFWTYSILKIKVHPKAKFQLTMYLKFRCLNNRHTSYKNSFFWS